MPMMAQKVSQALSVMRVYRHHQDTKGNIRSMADMASAQDMSSIKVFL